MTSVLAIVIKGAFKNVHKRVLLQTVSDMDLLKASKLWVSHFLGGRRTSLIIDGKVTEPRRVDFGISQGSFISSLLFLINISSLYRRIREDGTHVVGFIYDITIYKGGRDVEYRVTDLS